MDTPHSRSRSPRPAGRDVPVAEGSAGEATVVVFEEQLSLTSTWEPYRRLRIAKRIVQETRTVTIDVRREELVIEDLNATGGTGDGSQEESPLPLDVVLYEEQVTITRVVVPVERIRLDVARVEGLVEVAAEKAHEEVNVVRQ